jgi:hypothetical protein
MRPHSAVKRANAMRPHSAVKRANAMRRNKLQRYLSKNQMTPEERKKLPETFKSRCSSMFSGDGRLPENLRPISILVDGGEGCVVSFDARRQSGL